MGRATLVQGKWSGACADRSRDWKTIVRYNREKYTWGKQEENEAMLECRLHAVPLRAIGLDLNVAEHATMFTFIIEGSILMISHLSTLATIYRRTSVYCLH